MMSLRERVSISSSSVCNVHIFINVPLAHSFTDGGVYVDHKEFGGRARWGKSFGEGLKDIDENGHGTHCAGTAASAAYGVAKKANIVAVRVLDVHGSGYLADILSGLNWAGEEAKRTGRPAVVSMSIVGATSQVMDDTITAVRAMYPSDTCLDSDRRSCIV